VRRHIFFRSGFILPINQ